MKLVSEPTEFSIIKFIMDTEEIMEREAWEGLGAIRYLGTRSFRHDLSINR